MKRRWMLVLLLSLWAAPMTGCRLEAEREDDADLDVKVDDKGPSRGVEIDAD